MESTEIILGPPGTGKTTRLLALMETALCMGVEPERVGLISFTRQSVNEARDRAVNKFGIDPQRFCYFRTIHSLCFAGLKMRPGEVMQRTHYRDLGNKLGYKITGQRNDDQDVTELGIGDQMVFIEALSRLRRESYEDTFLNSEPDFSFEEFRRFFKTLQEYKAATLLSDYTDMLERWLQQGGRPSLDLLLIDEAQDLCRLQWDIVDILIKCSKKTYIAGDDDQAIFKWSGADPDHLIGLSNKYKCSVLDQSYRLPQQIYNRAEGVAKRLSSRISKNFFPTNMVGNAQNITNIGDVDIDESNWLILVRNRYQEREIVRQLRQHGYAFEGIKDKPLESDTLKAALLWGRIRKGEPVAVADWLLVRQYMTTADRGDVPWYEALDKLPDEDREYFLAARRAGESLVKKPRIKVSTIHGAKGGECDNVIIFPDISERTYRGYMQDPDSETRVFYVAITRAKKNLYIMEPETKNFYPL